MVKPGERVKRCTKCECWYGLDQFHKHAGRKDGRQSRCKQCKNSVPHTRYTSVERVAKWAVQELFWDKKRRAKHLTDGHPTKEQLLSLCGSCCAITKIPFSTERNFRPSPDRIDSNKGYIPGNVHWVLSAVNQMKSNRPMEEFRYFCGAVYLSNEK